MKFSERTSNQSTAGRRERMWPKWTVRRPTPMPRSGRLQRFMVDEEDGGRRPWRRPPPGSVEGIESRLDALAAALALAGALSGLGRHVLGLHGDLAPALALAGVLARTRALGGLAAAEALAVVLPLAVVLGRRRGAAALTLARVLAVGALALA